VRGGALRRAGLRGARARPRPRQEPAPRLRLGARAGHPSGHRRGGRRGPRRQRHLGLHAPLQAAAQPRLRLLASGRRLPRLRLRRRRQRLGRAGRHVGGERLHAGRARLAPAAAAAPRRPRARQHDPARQARRGGDRSGASHGRGAARGRDVAASQRPPARLAAEPFRQAPSRLRRSIPAARRSLERTAGMRVLLTAGHVYPMSALRSAGRTVTAFPSGSGQRLQDWNAKALAELGHEVVYCVAGHRAAPPPGVVLVDSLDRVDFARIDVAHTFKPADERVFAEAGVPYISVLHIHPKVRCALNVQEGTNDTVYVSRWLAQAFGSTRVVYNGVDPSEYLYSASKGDYFLFMASMDWAEDKGLDVAIDVAARAGRRLVVAGGARSDAALENAIRLCDRPDVDFVGDVQGPQKRWLL